MMDSTMPDNEKLLEQLAADNRLDGDTASTLARSIHAYVETQNRQAASLLAFQHTATDIINFLSIDDVFSAANKRAQSLLNSDIAYLAVFEEETGRTIVRASIGVQSADFNMLNVPLGAGVGGIIANSREPFITEDYIADPKLVHLPRVDRGIAAEGIRAMIGVPLIAREQFIGALFVADRKIRTYTAAEVHDLQALCTLVSVAIVNAKLFESKEKALGDIQQAYDSLRARTAATERIASLHDRFGTIIAHGKSCVDLINLLAKELDVELVLYDKAAQVIASRIDSGIELLALTPKHPKIKAAIQASLESGELEEVLCDTESDEHFILALGADQSLYGSLIVQTNRGLLGTERRTLERAGHIAALLLSRHQLKLMQTSSQLNQLLHDCLDGKTPQRKLQDRAQALGICLEQAALAAAFQTDPSEQQEILLLITEWAEPLGTLPGLVNGNVVAFVPTNNQDAINKWTRKLEECFGHPFNVGLTLCSEIASQANDAVKKATQALEIINKSGKAGTLAALSDLGYEAMLFNGNSPDELAAYINRIIGALQQYDVERGSKLISTLRHYFAANQNASQAAAALNIHPKTMVQRMDRIGQLLGEEWKETNQIIQIQVALHMHELINNGPK